MLDQVLAERMSPVELATWLRQLIMHSEDPMSNTEKSAIVCTLAVLCSTMTAPNSTCPD
jgi:hypothetical protein